MNYELLFSGVGALAMVGWLALLASPWLPKWSDFIAGLIIPIVLAAIYVIVITAFPSENGGFSSFREVTDLFGNPQAIIAGWIHFLAFDLLIGAWICRHARHQCIAFWYVLPCLPLTFMFGPAGFLAFTAIRLFLKRFNGDPSVHP